jgi:hypothetical protein
MSPLFHPPQSSPVITPPTNRAEYLIDVSNYQGNLDDNWFYYWGDRGFSGLIVQCVTGYDGASYTQQQCRMALSHSWELHGYIWCPSDYESRLHLFDGYELTDLWLDVEESSLTWAEIDKGFAACDNYLGRLSGMYTRCNMFENWTTKYSNRKLWEAYYSSNSDIDDNWIPFGGWTQRDMRQYSENPLDQNVARVR